MEHLSPSSQAIRNSIGRRAASRVWAECGDVDMTRPSRVLAERDESVSGRIALARQAASMIVAARADATPPLPAPLSAEVPLN